MSPDTTLSVGSKEKLAAHPIVCRVPYPQDIVDRLVTYKNPGGDINNSDFELVGGVFQHCCAADSYDVRERKVLYRTEILTACGGLGKAL